MAKVSDYDVLRQHHRFVRGDDETDASWEARVARNYESKLFREYALIDLKHYKSSRYALRWRTAAEVVDGVGEDTCAGLRCEKHRKATRTTAFELPFVYAEGGERKETLVKVRVCRRCEAKLTWKPEGERGAQKVGEGKGRRRSEDRDGEGRSERRRDRSRDRRERSPERRRERGERRERRDTPL